MKFKLNEKRLAGMDIFLMNMILVLYLASNNDEMKINMIIMMISSIIAIALNIYFLKSCKKSTINIVFLILNILVLIGIIYIFIQKFI